VVGELEEFVVDASGEGGDQSLSAFVSTEVCDSPLVVFGQIVHKPPQVQWGSVSSRRQSRPRPTMSTLLSSVMGTTPMLNNAISLPAQVPLGLVCVCTRINRHARYRPVLPHVAVYHLNPVSDLSC
jgi:hypothetical protein